MLQIVHLFDNCAFHYLSHDFAKGLLLRFYANYAIVCGEDKYVQLINVEIDILDHLKSFGAEAMRLAIIFRSLLNFDINLMIDNNRSKDLIGFQIDFILKLTI
jgi:hypothetical protein